MEKIKVLLINKWLHKGGTEAYFVNLSKFIDKNRFEVSLLVKNGGDIDQAFYNELKNNCKEVFVCGDESSTRKVQIKNLKEFFMDHKNYFDIVHINCTTRKDFAFGLLAKHYGKIKTIIFHSHMGGSDGKKSKLNWIYKILINKLASQKFACSTEASQFVFGSTKDVVLLNNSVDLEKYNFNEEIRQNKRKELNISKDEFVLLNVGRFEKQKNHTYLIEIFEELKKKEKQAKLLLVGAGKDEEIIRNLVKEKAISNVEFLGKRSDVSEIMQASDVLVMPSIHEGLPIVCVEAQATGLPIVISSNVSKESNVGGLCEFIGLEEPLNVWVDCILSHKGKKRQNVQEKIIENGFDNKSAIEKIEGHYLLLAQRKN